MISREQLRGLSKKYKIDESVVAREYVQIVFLKELYGRKFAKDVFFKGGTAIRLLYEGKRFSEDLDFTVQASLDDFDKKLMSFFSSLEKKYPFKFKPRKTLAGKTYLLTAKIASLKKSLIWVKLDFSMRRDVVEPSKSILKTEYPVVVQNFIYCLNKSEILAEKIRAVMSRKKHRDLYDLWILQELGGKIDLKLVDKKLEYYDELFDKKVFKERLKLFSKDGFVKDLRPFVGVSERDKLGELFDFVMVYLRKSGLVG